MLHSVIPLYFSSLPELYLLCKEVKVGNDQEMAQSERNSHFVNRGVGKKNDI